MAAAAMIGTAVTLGGCSVTSGVPAYGCSPTSCREPPPSDAAVDQRTDVMNAETDAESGSPSDAVAESGSDAAEQSDSGDEAGDATIEGAGDAGEAGG
jgi:hypothetical protein